MLQVREERVERTMRDRGIDEVQAINVERDRNFVNAAYRRNARHMPSWGVSASWSN